MSTSTESVPDSPSPPSSPEAEAEPEPEPEPEPDHFINPTCSPQQPPLSTDNSPSPSPSTSFFMASSSSLRLGVGVEWYYIIQTLADSKADLPLLKELVSRLPNFYTDAPQSVQERVALRYLEECASRGIVHTKDNTPGAVDISQPTVDFLCHNLKRPTDPCQPSQSRIPPVSDHIRQFISQKRSALPKPSFHLLKDYNAKLHSTRKNSSSSSHRQEDNIVDEEQEMITRPRLADAAGPTHNDALQNLPSQNALDTVKTSSEPLQENNPTTVIEHVSNLEAARSAPLSDDMSMFILKRRDAVSKTSVEEPKEPIPKTSIPIESSRNENDNNLRSNADFLDDPSHCKSFMGSPTPFSEQPIPETSIPIEPSRNENDNNLRSNADFLDDPSHCKSFMGSPIPFSEQPIPETSIPIEPSRNENDNNLRSNADFLDDPSHCKSFMGSPIPFSEQPIPETSIPIEPSRNENDNNLRSNADFLDDLSHCKSFMGSPIPFSEQPIPETSIPIEPSRNENDNNLRSNADFLDDPSHCKSFMGSPIPFSEQNQCVVCNKGGQLLTCSRKGCGITVHESCIMTTPSSFDKEVRFYCPCCVCSRAAHAYARAEKVFSLARESLSSFLNMKKDENQEKGEKGKQKVENNITGKRKGKKAVVSDDDTAENEDGDATLLRSELDSKDSSRRGDKNGKRKEKQVKSNDRNVSKDRDMLGGRGEEAKKHEAESAFAWLDKYIYVKSGPGATSGNHEAVPMNEQTGTKRRREDRINADAKKRKRCRPTPRYSNKVVAPRRRNMLPWSAEEEKVLREGMQKIGVPADGRIPWSAILECYRNVFHKTRLPNDLKDKWRNIMKKEESVHS